MTPVVLTINDAGQIEMIAGSLDLSEAGRVTKRRASHVEPINVGLRVAFHVIRAIVRDDSAAAGWTRGWPCLWRVRVVGGPTFGAFADRAAAIAAEVEWINENRFGG